MKFAYVLFAAATLSVSSSAQVVSTLPAPVPAPAQMYSAIKQYLTLSDAQLASLQQIQQNRQKAERAAYEQIRMKQIELDKLLQAGSNDSVTIGRLMVDINNLRRQAPASTAPYKAQALAILNDVQKQKTVVLQQALELQQTAWQGVSLNLLDTPRPEPRLLITSAEATSAEEPSVTVDSEQ